MLAMQNFLKFALQGFFEPFGGMLSSWIASGSLTVDLNSMSTVEDESIEYFVAYYPFDPKHIQSSFSSSILGR